MREDREMRPHVGFADSAQHPTLLRLHVLGRGNFAERATALLARIADELSSSCASVIFTTSAEYHNHRQILIVAARDHDMHARSR